MESLSSNFFAERVSFSQQTPSAPHRIGTLSRSAIVRCSSASVDKAVTSAQKYLVKKTNSKLFVFDKIRAQSKPRRWSLFPLSAQGNHQSKMTIFLPTKRSGEAEAKMANNEASEAEFMVCRPKDELSERPKPRSGRFTAEKAKMLRREMRRTETWHDLMYHSAIASKLAAPDR